jgi:cytochrome c oxidase subunit IV
VSHPTLEDVHVEHHIVGPKTYGLILLILLCLTALTTGIAFVNLGVFSPIAAIGIAVLKATLVILFFMHVKYSSRLVKLTVASGFFTFLVLITMTLSDYMSRAWGLWERCRSSFLSRAAIGRPFCLRRRSCVAAATRVCRWPRRDLLPLARHWTA